MDRRRVIKAILALGSVVTSISVLRYNFSRDTIITGGLTAYRDLIEDLAETIIPKTDTPGAKDAHVGEWIIKLIQECEPLEVQTAFANWLARLEKKCKKKYGLSFSQCSNSQRITLLTAFEHAEGNRSLIHRIRIRLFGADNMELMKKYTIISYCTSKEGATEACVYDYMPGIFDPCMTIEADQKCWATS